MGIKRDYKKQFNNELRAFVDDREKLEFDKGTVTLLYILKGNECLKKHDEFLDALEDYDLEMEQCDRSIKRRIKSLEKHY